MTLEQALELLAQPKALGRGRGVAAPPLKEMPASPVTGTNITLRDGRYGLYVTDGETNASLPKDLNGDDLTFEQAVDLLAARAAAGGSKKKKAPKRTVAKKATKPKKKAAKKVATSGSDADSDSDADADSSSGVAPAAKKKSKPAKRTAKKKS